MTWFIRNVASALIPALKDDDWILDGHHALHRKSNYKLWIASGWMFLRLDTRTGGADYEFNTIERLVLWRYVAQLKRKAIETKHHAIATRLISARLGQED